MPPLRAVAIALLGALCLGAAVPARAASETEAAMEPLDHAVCRLIEDAARTHRLPVGFVTRLIWRESSFRARAVSPAGAQGIAQFMPQTAAERGLADPFDPEEAIPKAARFLAELRRQFGNLGIAAAAYNAGPARVASWLRGQGELPAETRAYVHFVTERPPEAWTAAPGGAGGSEPGAASAEPESCRSVAADLRRRRGPAGADDEPGFAALAPWGVQLAGNFSKARALASFERARARYAAVIGEQRPMVIGRLLRSRGTRRFYQVRLAAPSRAVAEALCGRIQSVGGVCVAMRS